MTLSQSCQRVLIGLSLVMLVCAIKNYIAYLVSGTVWCAYLCPSLFEWQLLGDMAGVDALFTAQKWLLALFQGAVDHYVVDPWRLASGLIAAPVVEELIYRGPLYLTRRYARHPAWWLVGLVLIALFVLSHGRNGIALMPLLALGGYNLWLVASTRRLWPAISLHFLYNFIITSVLIYQSLWAAD